MGKENKKLEQKFIFEITKKLEQNDKQYFQNPNLQFITSCNFSDYHWTIIHLAVWHNRIIVLKELLKKPEVLSMINCVDTNQETALHLAFFDRKYDCAILLLENGAKFDVKNFMCNMLKRKIDKIKKLSQNQIDEQNNILMTHSDALITSNQLIEMEGSCLDDIPLEACPNQILEFKTKHFFQILEFYSTQK